MKEKLIRARLTLENQDGVYSVGTTDGYVGIDDYFRYLVEPVMLAAGFHPANIKEYIPDEEFSNGLVGLTEEEYNVNPVCRCNWGECDCKEENEEG